MKIRFLLSCCFIFSLNFAQANDFSTLDLPVLLEKSAMDTDPIIAIDIDVTTSVDLPVLVDVLASNDYDLYWDWDQNPCNVSITTAPSNGTASFGPAPDCVLTYTPDPSFEGTDTFEYLICTTSSSCDNATVIVNVLPCPFPYINGASEACLGEANLFQAANNGIGATYTWDFGPNATPQTSTDISPTVTFSIEGVETISLTVVKNGCSKTTQQNVTVTEPPVYTFNNYTICPGGTITPPINGPIGATYFWEPSTGLSDWSIPDPIISPPETTEYTVYVTVNGCVTTSQFTVFVEPLDVEAGIDYFTCEGDSVLLGGMPTHNVSQNASVSWTPTTGLSDPTIANPMAAPAVSTTYSVCVTTPYCTECDNVFVDVIQKPLLDAGPDQIICPGNSVTIGGNLNPFSSFQWSPTIGLSSPNAMMTPAFPTETTTYILEATRFGCIGRDTVTISVYPCAAFNFLKNDSLELVKIYEACDGENWTTPWDLNTRVETWNGITLSADGYNVEMIDLNGNGLTGEFPSLLMTNLSDLNLANNQLEEITDLSDLTELEGLNIANNSMRSLPDFSSLSKLNTLATEGNGLDFTDLIPTSNITNLSFAPQDSLNLQNVDPTTLTISIGGTLANNTYTWYKDDLAQTTITGDSTFTTSGEGVYRCEASSSELAGLTLFSKSLNICGAEVSENLVFLQDNTNDVPPYCPGTVLVFKVDDYTATSATNTYQFYVNSILVQNSSQNLYTSQEFSDGDIVSASVEGADGCQIFAGNLMPGIPATIEVDYHQEPKVLICQTVVDEIQIFLSQGTAPWQFDLVEVKDGLETITTHTQNNIAITLPRNAGSHYEIINLQDDNCSSGNSTIIPQIEGCKNICVGNSQPQLDQYTAHFSNPVVPNSLTWEIFPNDAIAKGDLQILGTMTDVVLAVDFSNPAPFYEEIILRASAETDCGLELTELLIRLDKNCVWPGDVNTDGQVTAGSNNPWIDDALSLYYAVEEYEAILNNINNISLVAYPRSPECLASTSYEWAAQSAKTWLLEDGNGNQSEADFDIKDEMGNVINTVNLKHADSNGNGEVEATAYWDSMNESFESILYHSDYDIVTYQSIQGGTHNGNAPNAKQNTLQELLHITAPDSIYNNGDEIVFSVTLGDADNVVENVVNVAFMAEGEFGSYGSPSISMAGVSHLSYNPADKVDYPVNLKNWEGQTGDSLNWYMSIQSENRLPKTFAGETICNAICHATVVGFNGSANTNKNFNDSLGIPVTFKIPATGIGMANGEIRYAQSNEVTVYVLPDPQLSARVFLEGPYDESTGWMRDDLRVRNLIPSHEPYSTNSSFRFPMEEVVRIGMTDSMAVLSVTGAGAVVDWVFIEVWNEVAPGDYSLVSTCPALLTRDGAVVDMDGVSPVSLPRVPYGDYHIVLRHRNHLPVMTTAPITLRRGVTNLDFTQIMANRQKELDAGIYGLYAGDATCEDNDCEIGFDINGEDRIKWSTKNGQAPRYDETDFDMNSDINGIDKVIWTENVGMNLTIPR